VRQPSTAPRTPRHPPVADSDRSELEPVEAKPHPLGHAGEKPSRSSESPPGPVDQIGQNTITMLSLPPWHGPAGISALQRGSVSPTRVSNRWIPRERELGGRLALLPAVFGINRWACCSRWPTARTRTFEACGSFPSVEDWVVTEPCEWVFLFASEPCLC